MKQTPVFGKAPRIHFSIFSPLIIALSFFLTSSISEASWPIELYTGKPLVVDTTADEEAVAVAMAPDGTLRLLTRTWWDEGTPFYFGLEYTLYALDREGNLLWLREQEHSYMIEEALSHNEYYPVIMKVGQNGETWIVWESYVNSAKDPPYEYPVNNSIRAVRFDDEGHDSCVESVFVEQGPAHMMKHPNHVEILDDGGVILLWRVARIYDDDAIPWEVRAQRFSVFGEELWTPGGVILDSTYDYSKFRYTSNPSVSDGNGGLLLTLGNELERLKSDGTLAWPRGTLVIEGMHAKVGSSMLEIEPGMAGVFGRGSSEGQWVVGFDSSGTLLNGQGYSIPFVDLGFNQPPTAWGNGYARAAGQYRILQFNRDLSPKFTEDPGEIFPWFGDESILNFSMGRHGIRFSIHNGSAETDAVNENVVLAKDTTCNEIWRRYVSDADSTHNYRTLPWLAPDGTTFIFWSEHGMKEGKRDIYANVVNLDGDWGVLETTSVPDREITLLPSTITMRAWPNPTNGRVTFNTTFEQPTRVLLYTITGREVWRGTLKPGRAGTVPLDHLPSGVYLLALPDAGVSQRITLMK